ncbi:hypothetical protein Q7C_911 [Methylophaga frappieri]|uniref:Uncharacterized protein n=1 Tax=Methylophaga frappieri (strain ATCC BAA-2434 / DSM 25690 / JAM7) TaxID=754477 RepID=I1YGN7_METFJ|nr:hypothetical protein [Methylophaga frappieri]AFJ02080.1 hypothetical protein Q7C_911 [Methylophaga frappieri]
MSTLTNSVDLSMFGCPVHKQKALAAAQQLSAGESVVLRVNQDAVSTIMMHLTTEGFLCEPGESGVLTTDIKVTADG